MAIVRGFIEQKFQKRIHCNAFIYIFMTELIFFSSDICFCESIWEEQLPRRKKNAV
jgi:hypothetical protein